MKIFPIKEHDFAVKGNQSEMLERLIRRTDKSENLTSQFTDKSFRGMINGNSFKLISSAIGTGAFCVMTGKIETNRGMVKAEINKPFRILLILLLLPLAAFGASAASGQEEFSPFLIFVALGQMLFIRYIFIGLVFTFLWTASLSRLRDVLDVEWSNSRSQ